MNGRTIDVGELIEKRRFDGFNLRLILASWIITVFDGFDLSIAAFTAPYIRDDLGLTNNEIANVISAGLLGTTIGAVLFASLSDRIGRRPVVLGCAFAFGLLTVASGLAPSYEWLLVIRLIDGLAIGAVVPIAWALNIEYVSKRMRATVVTIIMVGYSVGTSGAGPITVWLEPMLGWRGLFIAGGIGSLLAALLLIPNFPESLRWLVTRRDRAAQTVRMAQRLDQHGSEISEADNFVLADEPETAAKTSFRDLFAGWLAIGTPLLWIAYTASSIAIFYVNGFGPIIFEELGFDRSTAAMATAFGGVMGSVAGLLIMRFTDRLGPGTVLFYPALLLPVLLVLGLASLGQGAVLNMAMLVLALIGGMQFALISIIGTLYPTVIRARGSGWASSIGKLGGVLGPLYGGWVVSSGMPVIRSYAILAVLPALVILSVLGILLAKRRSKEADLPLTDDVQ